MLAIKEISRVPAVERKWLEARKRTENGGSPFPAVAQHIVDAESALAFGKRIHRHGIPTMKIKISKAGLGHLIAPRVSSCLSVEGTVGGTLPLRLPGERLPCPAGVGQGLSATHIYRP